MAEIIYRLIENCHKKFIFVTPNKIQSADQCPNTVFIMFRHFLQQLQAANLFIENNQQKKHRLRSDNIFQNVEDAVGHREGILFWLCSNVL